jgi:hypothetical protein
MAKVCLQCNKGLSQHNPSKLCFACQEKRREQDTTSNDELIDVKGYADILGMNPGSVRRLALQGKLAQRVPGIKRWLWHTDNVDAWIKQGGQTGNKDFRMAARGIARNMRTCRNDPMICIGLPDKIGDQVYGQEQLLGTTYMGSVEPVTAVKVDRNIALRVLKQLPKEDFPELVDITDWADLIYDRIDEDLIVRLEAHF